MNTTICARAFFRTLVLTLVVLLAGTGSLAAQQNGEATNNLWLESASSTPYVNGQSSYTELVEAVGPAVVNVMVSYSEEHLPPHARRSRMGPESLAQGSGFIIHPDGYIVTNFHVIDNAARVLVRLVDDTELEATVIGVDPATDLALMKVESERALPAVALGESAKMRPGDLVVAIGNPMGLNNTVTAGIISAVGRRDLPVEGQMLQGNFMQTDAPINPGNSGGPLINMDGEVIGINTAVNRHGQGISFAIPIDLVKDLLPRLKDDGYVRRSWLGVRIQPMDHTLARSFGLSDARGALVTEVLPDSPAEKAGIQEQDVILQIGNARIDKSESLPWLISTTPADSNVTFVVMRDEETREMEVFLEAAPNQERPTMPGARTMEPIDNGTVGIEVTTMTTRLARQLSAPEEGGVVVTSLSENSPARSAGLRDRDVILRVGADEVNSEDEFYDALSAFTNGDIIRLQVLRRGRVVYMAFTK